ncbi:MAG: FAD-binding oxidoreductase [Gammaproteobacteria bacterium]|nr:FAD-binding oxidoreductase [Gammaproteobacteria bacterium]MDH4256150.1 FAD-binding oxidoreductase [Gammaproteobacteria bacterium]MDH5311254.1 FAD-binding oxidoreductase [Gammaproteobacteria bacterium]
MTSPQPHTTSYYAATAGEPTDYPPLEGDVDTDVCVIGAGFTGVSAALHLAERGYRVRLLEANRIGWGASGRNGGQVIGGISGEHVIARRNPAGGEELVWQMRWAGHDIIRDRVQRYDIDCDLKWGYLDVALLPRHMRDFEREHQRLERHRFPYEFRLNDVAATRELIGTKAYIGSLLNMGNGHLHPLRLCIGEARAASGLGAAIHEKSPVTGIEHGARPRVRTDRGSVSADFVVLAGNAYHDVDRRLRGFLFPVNSFIIATEPLPPEVVARINPRDLAVCDPNFVLEYFRLSADKRLLFGGRLRHFGEDQDVIRTALRRKMLRIYPSLDRYAIDYAWTGTIGVTVNRVPQLGRLAPNVFYSQGYSGHGVNVTHLAGQIVAEAIAGTMERFDVFERIRPVVLPGAWLLRRPLVELGLMYYQLRDRI